MSHEVWITQVADHEIIGLGLAEPRELEIGASHPEAFALEPFDKMVADETTGPAHQRSFYSHWFRGHLTSSRLFRNQMHAFRTMPYTACRLAWLEESYRPSGETPSPELAANSAARRKRDAGFMPLAPMPNGEA